MGEPRTIDVPLTPGQSSASWEIPPGVTFDLEAVYVELDATGAGGAVTPELTLSEQSGVVIARKAQDSTVPAGGTGTATWALRLAVAAQAAGPSPVGVPAQEVVGNEFALVVVAGGAADFTFIQDSGATLLNFTNPTAPTIITSGVYAVTGYVTLSSTNSLTAAHDAVMVMDVGGTPLTCASSCVRGSTGGSRGMALSLVGKWTAGNSFHVTVHNWDAVNNQYACVLSIERLW